MKRKLFFWLEQLKITRTERRAISMLLMILAGLVSVNAMVKPTSPFDNEYYSELEKEFQLRTGQLQQQEEQRLARYSGLPNIAVAQDTIPDESNEPATNSVAGPLINVNMANAQMLQKLTGIGAAYAQRIIRYRSKHGPYKSKDDLLKIKGVGSVRLQKMSAQITLGEMDSVAVVKSDIITPAEKTPKEKAAPRKLINVNTAGAQTLQKLDGIGPAYAQHIIHYRETNGDFTAQEQLLKVKGIGKKRLAKIKPFIKLTDQ